MARSAGQEEKKEKKKKIGVPAAATGSGERKALEK